MSSGNKASPLTPSASYSIVVGVNNDVQAILFDVMSCADGVSEGQFKQVLEQELPLLKSLIPNFLCLNLPYWCTRNIEACADLNIDPKITIIVVGKRHHVRYDISCYRGTGSGWNDMLDSSRNRTAMQTGVAIVLLARWSIVKLPILPNLISISKVTVDS